MIYNFFGACGKDKMSPVGDSEYIKDQQGKLQTTDKEIAELEASEAHQKEQQQQLQQQQTAAGYVPSPEEQKRLVPALVPREKHPRGHWYSISLVGTSPNWLVRTSSIPSSEETAKPSA